MMPAQYWKQLRLGRQAKGRLKFRLERIAEFERLAKESEAEIAHLHKLQPPLDQLTPRGRRARRKKIQSANGRLKFRLDKRAYFVRLASESAAEVASHEPQIVRLGHSPH